MFRLTKWYLDLVTSDGSVLIVYAARLRWNAVRLTYASSMVAPVEGSPRETSRWTGVTLPESTGGDVHFAHPGLAVRGRWVESSPPVEACLFEDDDGSVRWDVFVPGGRAEVAVGEERLEGLGYAERLTFTRPPWNLPLRRLRWGRFVSDDRALVWIRWDDDPAHRWTYLNGVPQPTALASGSGVTGLDEGARLDLGAGRVLCDRKALKVVSRRLPALETMPLGPLADLREVKRLDRGRLHGPGATESRGWTIHEEVTW